jgi:hypothetical protein
MICMRTAGVAPEVGLLLELEIELQELATRVTAMTATIANMDCGVKNLDLGSSPAALWPAYRDMATSSKRKWGLTFEALSAL